MKNIEFKPARITRAIWEDTAFDIPAFATYVLRRHVDQSIEDMADTIRAAEKVTFTIEIMDGDQ